MVIVVGTKLEIMGLIGIMCLCFRLALVEMLLLTAAATATPAIAKPDCPTHCGDLEIPYPFGTKPGCFLNEDFLITCNETTKPFFRKSIIPVTNITMEGRLQIQTYPSKACFNQQEGNNYESGNTLYLSLAKWRISETQNKFTVLGCDSLAYINGKIGDRNYRGGCMASCGSLEDVIADGTCSGSGCCQIDIPKGLIHINVTAYRFNTTVNEAPFNPCTYAFVIEETQFQFNKSNLISSPIIADTVPTAVDWAITGQGNCEEAKKHSSYACKEYAECYPPPDRNSTDGYLCKCQTGFQGNPYLGCQDVDECADQNLNLCVMKCTNMAGNYSCGCPPAYNGDGRRDGNGCVKIRSWVVPAFIGISAGVGFLLLILGVFWVYKAVQKSKATKLKQKCFERNGGLLLKKKLSSNEGTSSVEKTRLFTSSELEIATDRFNENRILGRGGTGTVYKGMLADGTLAAVKKSQAIDKEQLEIFINEVVILSQIRHRNVVKLFGCCLETEVPLLVYEFIPNGTLSNVIHDQNEEFPLTWELRLRIATDVSSAISYLHSAASVPIYHRDVKTANIILDNKFRAKLTDFGISKSVALDETHLTTQVKGTFGYFDPEYFRSSQFTEKSDVYSYGVVLVELLTGKKPICSFGSQEKISLAAYFVSLMEENPEEVLDILDAKVVKEDRKEELMAVAHLAKRCLELNGRNRPTMREVAMELERMMILKGYLTNGQKKVPFVVKNTVRDREYSSTSIACFSDGCINFNSAKNVHPFLFNTE